MRLVRNVTMYCDSGCTHHVVVKVGFGIWGPASITGCSKDVPELTPPVVEEGVFRGVVRYVGIGQVDRSLCVLFGVGVHGVVNAISLGFAIGPIYGTAVREGAGEVVVMVLAKVVEDVCIQPSLGFLVLLLAGSGLIDHGRRADGPALGAVVHCDHAAAGDIHGGSGQVRVLVLGNDVVAREPYSRR